MELRLKCDGIGTRVEGGWGVRGKEDVLRGKVGGGSNRTTTLFHKWVAFGMNFNTVVVFTKFYIFVITHYIAFQIISNSYDIYVIVITGIPENESFGQYDHFVFI